MMAFTLCGDAFYYLPPPGRTTTAPVPKGQINKGVITQLISYWHHEGVNQQHSKLVIRTQTAPSSKTE